MKLAIRALFVAIWFMVLCAPVVGLHINTDKSVSFYWERLVVLGFCVYFLSIVWQWYFRYRAMGASNRFAVTVEKARQHLHYLKYFSPQRMKASLVIGVAAFAILQPWLPGIGTIYQVSIMISALIYVMLALGLNIAVGLAGQLVLGYAGFYAIGAYTYGLLYHFAGMGFWACLPVAGLLAVLFGLALGFPTLRLRGDYLAIVTLGFGEIVRLVLLNWVSVTGGSVGISGIPRPSFFGIELTMEQSTIYLYYLCLIAVAITITVIARLKNSRVGLALQALREDEIASEAMGINLTQVKLQAFALSSAWAGFAGVLFAAKTSFINPPSFTFMESAMMLAMVVLGGMGSILGVVLSALVLILVPEYLRAFSDYRMLIFGAVMVLMMLFRPQGLISGERPNYKITELQGKEAAND